MRTIQRSTHSRCEFGILKSRQHKTYGLRGQRVLPPQAEYTCFVRYASGASLTSLNAGQTQRVGSLKCSELLMFSRELGSGERIKPLLLVRAGGVSIPARTSGTSTGRQTLRRRLLLKEGTVTNITRKKLALTAFVLWVEDRYLVRGARRRYFECNANARIESRP